VNNLSFSHFDRVMMATEVARRPRSPAMSEQELREFKAAMEKLRLENTSSREKATQFLKEEGFLDENGEVSKRYSAAVAAA
jgi:hypothetical protein